MRTWNAESVVSQKMTIRAIERYFEELELILRTELEDFARRQVEKRVEVDCYHQMARTLL